MFPVLLILFVVMPIVELSILVRVHDEFGFGPTFGLVLLTGVFGAWLARKQGRQTLVNLQSEVAEGRTPAPHMIDGFMILMAGMVLITPGLVTDAIGFLLLVPIVRKEIRVWIRRWLEAKVADGSVTIFRG